MIRNELARRIWIQSESFRICNTEICDSSAVLRIQICLNTSKNWLLQNCLTKCLICTLKLKLLFWFSILPGGSSLIRIIPGGSFRIQIRLYRSFWIRIRNLVASNYGSFTDPAIFVFFVIFRYIFVKFPLTFLLNFHKIFVKFSENLCS